MSSLFTSRGSSFLLLVFVIITLSYSLSFATSDESHAWKLLRKKSAANFVSKGSAKKFQVPKTSAEEDNNNKSVLAAPTRSTTSTSKDGTDTVRQYGHYSSSSYGGSGGGYDFYTLIAVSAFAALFGALIFELVTNGSLRSMNSGGSLQLPFGLDSEQLPMLVTKITEWISNTPWVEEVAQNGVKSRTVRDVGNQIGLSRWIQAYKKDPVEYQCIRKVACETLAGSTLIEKSMKSPFGGIFLAAVGAMMDGGDEIRSIVRETMGNPQKCQEMVPSDYCDDDNGESLSDNKTK